MTSSSGVAASGNDPGYTQKSSDTSGFTPGQVGQFGFYPGYQGGNYPNPKKIKAPVVKYQPIESAPFQFTDPMEFARKFSNFNTDQIKNNFNSAKDLALGALDTELQGLKQFTPAASALKRSETSLDNAFNQSQRSAQVEQALPGVNKQLSAQADRAEAFASGRAPDSITDRALELGIRSRSADNASAGGFGAQSSVARKASDLMSAEQRIGLSQYGDQLLSSNINQKAALNLAPTEYSNAGSQISVMPSLSGSQLQTDYLGKINQSTLLSPETAFTASINQNEFATNLEQGTRQYNASNALQVREFNVGNKMAARQFNANNINQFALGKFQYDVGYAGTVAGAAQTNANTNLQLDLMAQYKDIFQAAQGQAQQVGQAGAISQGIAAILPNVAPILSGIGSIASSIFGGGGGGSGSTQQQPQAIATTGGEGVGGGGGSVSSPNTGGGGYQSGESFGAPQGSVVVPSGSPAPSGYTASGGMSVNTPDGGGGSVYIPDSQIRSATTGFSQDTGFNVDGRDQSEITKAMIQSGATAKAYGISDSQGPGMEPIGVGRNGAPVYTNTALAANPHPAAGGTLATGLRDILDPTGVLSNSDSSTLSKLGAVAQDATLISSLTAMQQNGDAKGFMNTVLGATQQPLLNSIDDPKNKEGLAGAFTAYNLYQNWDRMSGAQKGLGIASLGIQGFKFQSGENLGDKFIAKPVLDGAGKVIQPGLSVSQGLGLLQAGINTYSLAKNWGQMNNIQKLAGATQEVGQIAGLAKQFGMLGSGTSGAAVATSESALAASGWSAVPHMGIGAVTAEAGAEIPAGYTAVANTIEGKIVAAPIANADSAAGAASGAFSTVAGVASIAAGTYQVYQGWGMGGSKGAKNGLMGGSAIAGGLWALGATNPFLLGGIVAVSVIGNMVKTGKEEHQNIRDDVRSSYQKNGFVDKDYNVTLADGSKAYIGDDGHSGEHDARNPSGLVSTSSTGKLHSYDIDYTNDLDYTAGMGGTTLSRLLGGGSSEQGDQMGGQLGNASISKIGYGKDMTPENFNSMAQNQRAIYAQAGIKSKADGYQLTNQMLAENRIDESTAVTMQQSLNMIFDKDGYATAKKLMGGRDRGVEVAKENAKAEMPVGDNRGASAPAVSATEAARMKDPGFAAGSSLNDTKYNMQNSALNNKDVASGLASAVKTYKGGAVTSLSKEEIKAKNQSLFKKPQGKFDTTGAVFA